MGLPLLVGLFVRLIWATNVFTAFSGESRDKLFWYLFAALPLGEALAGVSTLFAEVVLALRPLAPHA
jgi:hypothetical protein